MDGPLIVRSFKCRTFQGLLILYLLEDPNHKLMGVMLDNRVKFLPYQLLELRIKHISLPGGLIIHTRVK